MLKYSVRKWDQNKKTLKQNIVNLGSKLNDYSYKDIVKLTVDNIFNTGSENDCYEYTWNTSKIVEIDNGDYQGTLLYIIPLSTYQPSESEYLMTHVSYGSCSGCDTLQSIQMTNWSDDEEQQIMAEDTIESYMSLCLHIVQNTIKPYNDGWREDEEFNHVEEVR